MLRYTYISCLVFHIHTRCRFFVPAVCYNFISYMACNDSVVKNDEGTRTRQILRLCLLSSGFGGLGVACWPLLPKFAGSNPAVAVGFLRAKKNPQHAFLRRGSKAVGPMS